MPVHFALFGFSLVSANNKKKFSPTLPPFFNCLDESIVPDGKAKNTKFATEM